MPAGFSMPWTNLPCFSPAGINYIHDQICSMLMCTRGLTDKMNAAIGIYLTCQPAVVHPELSDVILSNGTVLTFVDELQNITDSVFDGFDSGNHRSFNSQNLR